MVNVSEALLGGALIIAAGLLVAVLVYVYNTRPNYPAGRFQFHVGTDGSLYVLNTRNGYLWLKAAHGPGWVQQEVPWA